MSGRLTGVGVGPGDPDLVTLKGLKVLRGADVVLVPVSAAGSPGYAEGVVLAHVDPARVRRVVFALGDDDAAARERGWEAAADAAIEVLDGGGHAAFATIGDPNVYSTFTYLAEVVRRRAPGCEIATVPGITAMQDLAARSGTVLVEGDQTMALLPFTAGAERVASALAEHDTVVAYKGGRALPELRAVIADAGRLPEAVFGARLGMVGEVIEPLQAENGPAPYLSTVIVRRA